MERLKHIVQINILFGAWLIVAPFIMGYSASTVELANDVALGSSWGFWRRRPAPTNVTS